METLKKQIVRHFAAATNIKELRGNKVILVTALGLISGKLCDPKSIEEEISGASVMAALCDTVVEDYGPENIDSDDGFILLTDVTIRTGGNVNVNIGNLVVFYDQIIGVSFGNTD